MMLDNAQVCELKAQLPSESERDQQDWMRSRSVCVLDQEHEYCESL